MFTFSVVVVVIVFVIAQVVVNFIVHKQTRILIFRAPLFHHPHQLTFIVCHVVVVMVFIVTLLLLLPEQKINKINRCTTCLFLFFLLQTLHFSPPTLIYNTFPIPFLFMYICFPFHFRCCCNIYSTAVVSICHMHVFVSLLSFV